MKKTRREVIKLGVSAAVTNSRIVSAGVTTVAVLTGCGGGSSNGTSTTNSVTPPSGLSYQGPVQGTVGTALAPLTPTVTGTVSSYTVSPAFPAGVSLSPSTGVISGTPTVAAGQATYTVTASNSGGSTSFALLMTIKGVIVISPSTTTPTALTPVALSVTGLDFTQAFSVQLINSSGYSATLPPVRNDATNKIVIVAAPLYFDPNTGKTAPLTASVQITQGTVTSNAISWAISDIPSVASYGVNPGEISHAFFNALAIGFGMNVNALQAMRALPTSKTDTSTVQSHQTAQQLSAIEARDNVDLIISGTRTSIPIGTASDGIAVNYDANSVDILDRILGIYLQSIGYLPTNIYPANPLHTVKPYVRRSRRNLLMPDSINAKDIIDSLGLVGGAIGLENAGIQTATAENSTDSTIAIGQGVATGALILGTIAEAPALVAAATIVGTVYAGAAIVNDFYKWYTASNALSDALANGDATKFEESEKELSDARANLNVDLIGGALGVLGFPSEVAGELGVAKDTVEVLDAAQNGGTGLAVQGISLITSAVGLAITLNGIEMKNDGQTMAQSNAEIPASANSFGLVEGSDVVSNINPPVLDPLNGAYLTETTTNTPFTTLAGDDNNYMLIVPLGVPGYNYSQMLLAPYDPAGNVTTGSQVPIDLSTLTSTNPYHAQGITGTCNDTDAGNPDQDDPDCD
jgi:hypothetical protein